MTTIAISKDLKEKIRNISNKGESYEKIIEKMYEMRKNQLISEILMDTSNCVSIEDALKEAKSKWSK